ncbi:hypothetical protein A167_00336 [Alcanivorax sp. S71-1-4]|uniref:DUF6868 family protein n=1 Tax=Alcanivorax sp. S71-1-4 TaxID=1177159 RepID=UPI00135BB8D0|nr:hypothetical protein [Alcanivorax sp. S71-1-4]KAF0810849.1 hypothetical protein A167_00336 [Alcanivorax sp. S71-1-4]
MPIAELKALLWWSALINYLFLFIWFGAITLAHDAIFRLHTRWFALSMPTFDALHYGGMALLKIGILLLNLTPLLVLCIVY